MKPYVSVLGIPRFVLICCALFLSWAKADKTTRRFVGLPESGQRVSYSDTSGNNRTLIIRHNLPVGHVVDRSEIYPQWHANLYLQAPSLFRPAEFNLNRTEQQGPQSNLRALSCTFVCTEQVQSSPPYRTHVFTNQNWYFCAKIVTDSQQYFDFLPFCALV